MNKSIIFLSLFFLIISVQTAFSEVLVADTVWQGEINLHEDVLIPLGVVLEVQPGTIINIWPASSTQLDPEYLSHNTEILVRGKLVVMGSAESPVHFGLAGADRSLKWAGIIVQGGQVELEHVVVQDAEVGCYVVSGRLEIKKSLITANRYGLIGQGGTAQLDLHETKVWQNDYGLLGFDGARISSTACQIQENSKVDFDSITTQMVEVVAKKVDAGQEVPLTRVYNNETLRGNTIWSGRIRINGQVRVADTARLIIMPGTIVEFSKLDSNGDGIGENGILAQGAFFAKGTKERPIVFRSAESVKARGDWDSINILGSDQTRNLLEFCLIENAYRGLHFHFANVAVTNSVLRGNFRAMQFQESLVEIRDSQLTGNNSAIQARDSHLILSDNQIYHNINGADLFRMNLKAQGNLFANNLWDGLRIREGATEIEHNSMVGNRNGLVVYGAVYGRFNGNLLAGNLENGLVLGNNDNIQCDNNAVMGNGFNGIKIKDSRAVLQGNFIADNRHRGIAITTFSGRIMANNFTNNGEYEIGLDGVNGVDATGNWWFEADLRQKIYDRYDNKRLGLVNVNGAAKGPFLFTWPVSAVPVDLNWAGLLRIDREVTIDHGVSLAIKPATVLKFGKGAGLDVYGKLTAVGTADKRITFTSMAGIGPMDWGEISLTKAMNSIFENCDFEYAFWAIHCHFTNLQVIRCRFRHNDGGIRFRSGPLEVAASNFRRNRIAIRSFRGFGEIKESVISENEIGLFIREKGAGLKLFQNNLNDNERYSLRLGDFNDEDVSAGLNWWGVEDVVSTLFDSNREPGVGRVLYEPVLQMPISPELEEWQ